ncbi:MAG: hypothetical protein K8H88_14860 [Sandaracinaceae bacterium]|nr:hypothetical protein [Sandaracinaceae bacterium]
MSRQSFVKLARALEREAHRAKDELRSPGQRPPYFVSYLVRDIDSWWMDARFGTLFGQEKRRWRRCFADVRVGTYRYDQVREGGLEDNSTKSESFNFTTLPIGESLDGVLHGIWQLTESRYREAAEDFLEKRADAIHYQDANRGLVAFERREPIHDVSVPSLPEVDVAHWTRFLEDASTVGKSVPGAYGSTVELNVRQTTRVLVSTEGTLIVDRMPLWQLSCMLDLSSEDGFTVPWNLSWLVGDPDELPGLEELKSAMRRAFKQMAAIAKAPTLRAYSGPVLLDPRPAGLLMHEAIGHRLEGNRLLSPGEGQTFRDSLGSEHLPPFLSMRDDPTMTQFGGRSLVGSFRYDDEGVAAARADLVDHGKIRGYLTSRAGISKSHHSNGHARNDSFERPVSRMGVTLVETDDGMSDVELKRALIEEVKERNLPFGVHVLAADSGETATKAYDFQAFLGEIRAANLVYPDGREEPVRDVNFVGTPLNAVRGIVGAGSRYEVDNSYCGAESGAVPVSTISPALLVDDLELQSSARSQNAPHTYSLPWVKKSKKR